MKVKCIDNNNLPWGKKLTIGKEYEVLKTEDDHYTVKNDNQYPFGYKAKRFEVIPEDPVEEKKKEISDAKNTLEKLEKELNELTAPKVGNKFLHKRGNKYVLVQTCYSQFILVCYEGENIGNVYGLPVKKAEGVFHDCAEFFTLIPE